MSLSAGDPDIPNLQLSLLTQVVYEKQQLYTAASFFASKIPSFFAISVMRSMMRQE